MQTSNTMSNTISNTKEALKRPFLSSFWYARSEFPIEAKNKQKNHLQKHNTGGSFFTQDV